MGDIVEHVLPFVVLDAAEEPAARHVFAGLLLEWGRAANIDGLFVHAPGPERQPTKTALEHPHPQLRIFVVEAAADEGTDKPHGAPGVSGEPAEEDILPKVLVARRVGRGRDGPPGGPSRAAA